MKRYSNIEFPPYAFVPGRNPHPRSHPEGHLYNKQDSKPDRVDDKLFLDSQEYLYGIDLFNYGYYWEAHEVWESLWNAHNREGNTANFLKALIRLSASGVKVKQGQEKGINDHSLAASDIFKNILYSTNNDLFLGLSLSDLIDFIKHNIDSLKSGEFNNKIHDQIVFNSFITIK